MAGENGRAFKKLKMAETIKAGEWLRQNWEELRKAPPTYPVLARRMSDALAFEVPLGSVPALVKALGYEWPEVASNGTTTSGGKPTGRTIILARAIRDIYERLGEPCPAGIRAICNSTPAAADPERPLLG